MNPFHRSSFTEFQFLFRLTTILSPFFSYLNPH